VSESMKLCPWCGQKPRVVTVAFKYERVAYWRVKCDRCAAYGPPERATGLNRERGREQAIGAWNRRAPDADRAAAMALVRELREAAKPFVEAARVYDLYDGPPTHRHLRDNHEILCAGHGDELATLTVGDLRKLRARAEALAGEPGEGGEEKREDFAARMIRTYSPREEKPQGGKRG